MMPSKLPESVSYLHVHCFQIYIIKLIGICSCVETGEYSGSINTAGIVIMRRSSGLIYMKNIKILLDFRFSDFLQLRTITDMKGFFYILIPHRSGSALARYRYVVRPQQAITWPYLDQ